MARKASTPTRTEPSTLLVLRQEAESKIDARIKLGEDLMAEQISNKESLKDAKERYYDWTSYNTTLLKMLFSGDEIQHEYSPPIGIFFGGPSGFLEQIEDHRDTIRKKVAALRRIRGKLELFSEHSGARDYRLIAETGRYGTTMPEPLPLTAPADKVFLVHGHDRLTLLEVKDFLRTIGVEPVILSEKANRSMTIIEKFQHHSAVKFAVVLMTPDDLGESRENVKTIADLKPRARQNVLLELGAFMANLGRGNTAILFTPGVELPSDYAGVAYISLEDSDWRTKLASELQAAGVSFNHRALAAS